MENRFFNENQNYWGHILLLIIFFLTTPIIITTSLFSLFQISKISNIKSETNQESNLLKSPQSGIRVYASLPLALPEISGSIEKADARSEIIRQYLSAYHSPLEPFAQKIVDESTKNKLDYRLLTAIAQQESNLCKVIPPETYNCWGWGIHSKGTLGFSSYNEAIETVSKGIKENYIDKGYETVEDIMSKYTPLSEGSWALGINKFMNEIEEPF